MYILELNQDGDGTEIAVFDTLEEGRRFVAQFEGYQQEEIDGFIYERISLESIPDYLELNYKGHIIPFTRFMFVEDGPIEVYWKEIPNLSTQGQGMVSGVRRVDAYSVENEDLKEYIEAREAKFEALKAYLESRDYEVARAYFGSEDGEAILYRKHGREDWHFLTHLDPNFTEEASEKEILSEMLPDLN